MFRIALAYIIKVQFQIIVFKIVKKDILKIVLYQPVYLIAQIIITKIFQLHHAKHLVQMNFSKIKIQKIVFSNAHKDIIKI